MPAIARWSRSSGMELARLVDGLGELVERRRRPGLRAERLDHLVGLDAAGPVELRPGTLLGAELAQAQLAPVGEPDEHPRGAVLERRALVEHLEAPGAHQVNEQLELLVAGELDDGHLADASRARNRHALEGGEHRVEGLDRDHARRQGRLDLGAVERRAEAAGGDLDFGQFGHRPLE